MPAGSALNDDAERGDTAAVRPWAVLDIDGVLADVRHRLPHLRPRRAGREGRADWNAFFAHAADDPLLPEGAAVAMRLVVDHDLVYVSGRPERLRQTTEAWLNAHGLPRGAVVLRGESDRRPARVVKREILLRLARERPVAIVVDDDVEVVAALESAGFPVLRADWALPEGNDRSRLRSAQEREGRS